MKIYQIAIISILIQILAACGSSQPQITGRSVPVNTETPEPSNDNLDESEDLNELPEEEVPEEVVKTIVDPSQNGNFQFDFYDQGLDSEAYQSARVYYPIPNPENPGPFPATTTSGGFTNVKEDMYWFAERMASHGFIVIAFTPTNNNSLDPQVWNTGHQGGIGMLESESLNQESPIYQQVDVNKLGISGFSMGGAGTILAANAMGDKIKVAAPFNAFQPVDATMTAATIFVSGSADRVAIPANIKNSYDSLNGTNKVYANFEGYGHAMTNPGIYEADISTYVVSWYQLHMNDNELYKTFFNGVENSEDLAEGVFEEGSYEISILPN